MLHAIGVMLAIDALVKSIDRMEAPPKLVTPVPAKPQKPGKIRRYCDYCKSEFDAEPAETNCPYCGAPVGDRLKPVPTHFSYYAHPKPAVPVKKLSTGWAIAALVFSLIGLASSWVPIVGMIIPVAGLVLSSVAFRKSRQEGYGGKGLATAGIVLSAIAMVIGIVMTVILFS